MEVFDRKKHWENIYQTKKFEEVSWYQKHPNTSIEFLNKFNIKKDAEIIDVGGGDSYFVDYLLELGYRNITVLDISESAIERAKSRLGNKAASINWVVEDVAIYKPEKNMIFGMIERPFIF